MRDRSRRSIGAERSTPDEAGGYARHRHGQAAGPATELQDRAVRPARQVRPEPDVAAADGAPVSPSRRTGRRRPSRPQPAALLSEVIAGDP